MTNVTVDSSSIDFIDTYSTLLEPEKTSYEKVAETVHTIAFFIPRLLFEPLIKRALFLSLSFKERHIVHMEKEFEKIWTKPVSVESLSQANLWHIEYKTKGSIEKLRDTLTPKEVNIKTSDGVTLNGIHFTHKNNKTKDVPTLIYFGGTGELSKSGFSTWVLSLLQKSSIPFNLVMFDTRGVGRSEGTFEKEEDFTTDAESIYQYVHRHLGVSEDQIHVAGFSLGGAIATLLKANHPDTKGFLLSNRSFSSMGATIKETVKSNLESTIGSFLAGAVGNFIAWLAYHFGYDMNVLDEFATINSPKLVIAHENDPVIPYKASMHHASQDRVTRNITQIKLHAKDCSEHFLLHHTESLKHYVDEKNLPVEKLVLEFMENAIKA